MDFGIISILLENFSLTLAESHVGLVAGPSVVLVSSVALLL